ncbi:MAG: hypothetical protein U0Y10_16695 [Spirosomataceae bacterium]
MLLRLFGLLLLANVTMAQSNYGLSNAHSHNDYEQKRPFWEAFERGFGSIEADIYLVKGELYVAHNQSDIKPERTLENLYIKPLVEKIKQAKANQYPMNGHFQWLIDLKTGGETLRTLEAKLKPYRQYFDQNQNKKAIRIVISGEMPKPNDFDQFDTIFTFDGRKNISYSPAESKRIVILSENFWTFGPWQSDGTIKPETFIKVSQFVDSVHQAGKQIRFWATPNKVSAYETLKKLKVDYIGTDSLRLLHEYLSQQGTKN